MSTRMCMLRCQILLCVCVKVATLASGPFNYARNMQYATPSSQPATGMFALIRDLFRQAAREVRGHVRILFCSCVLRLCLTSALHVRTLRELLYTHACKCVMNCAPPTSSRVCMCAHQLAAGKDRFWRLRNPVSSHGETNCLSHPWTPRCHQLNH